MQTSPTVSSPQPRPHSWPPSPIDWPHSASGPGSALFARQAWNRAFLCSLWRMLQRVSINRQFISSSPSSWIIPGKKARKENTPAQLRLHLRALRSHRRSSPRRLTALRLMSCRRMVEWRIVRGEWRPGRRTVLPGGWCGPGERRGRHWVVWTGGSRGCPWWWCGVAVVVDEIVVVEVKVEGGRELFLIRLEYSAPRVLPRCRGAWRSHAVCAPPLRPIAWVVFLDTDVKSTLDYVCSPKGTKWYGLGHRARAGGACDLRAT